jgi:hypothetical protein
VFKDRLKHLRLLTNLKSPFCSWWFVGCNKRENAAQEGGGEKGDGCQGKGKSAGAMPSLARVLDPPTLRTPFAALTVLGSLP